MKVVDFGISKSLRASDEEEEQPRLTQTGMVLGTPLYMSPEQARGDDELDAPRRHLRARRDHVRGRDRARAVRRQQLPLA